MVQSFTWPMLPGGLSSAPLYSVWMESTMRTSGSSSETDWSTSSSAVSDSTKRLPPVTPSRWARSFNCRTDSSPETYSTRFFLHRLPQIWSMRVDLPTPGAPPTRTREPFTAPPPSTRSSSPMPVPKRISSVVSMSVRAAAFTEWNARPAPEDRPDLVLGAASCSTMVFHAPQAMHLPAHLGVSLPHSVQ